MFKLKKAGIISLFFLCSCNPHEKYLLIIGDWNGSEWLVDGKPGLRNAQETHFNFNDGGNYTFIYGSTIEKGKYKIDDNKLYTKPLGQEEIMVNIGKLTADSLIFVMNRSGVHEILILLKSY
ncbi:MAG: lipocalin family protein [Ferruginibacter sp.]